MTKISKWNSKENCHKEALKYETRSDLKYNCSGAYTSAIKNNWLDDICFHMKPKRKIDKTKFKWGTIDKVHIEALKYNTRLEFQKENTSAYQSAYKNNWLDIVCSHMTDNLIKWTFDKVNIEAKKYNNRLDFVKNNKNAYQAGLRNNWLNIVCLHMKWNGGYSWTKEECLEKALLCKNRSEFAFKYNKQYSKANKENWLDDICNHMPNVINQYLFPRIIYAYIFENNSIYIGLTKNFKLRQYERKRKFKDTVTKFIKETKLQPKIIFLTDYVSAIEAQKLEQFYIDEYRSKGWNILNKIKGGSLGGPGIKIVEHL